VKISVLVLLFILVFSCKTENQIVKKEKVFPVLIEKYQSNNIFKIDSTTLTIKRKTDSIEIHLFGVGMPIEINLNDNSYIIIWETKTKLLGEKEYSKNGKTFNVKKYHYDDKNMIDEEGNYFLYENRVIGFFSTAWDLFNLYKYNQSEVYSLLMTDSTSFFNYRKTKRRNNFNEKHKL
jgi:hypothetical protein